MENGMGDPIGPFSSPISLFTLSILLNLSGILLPCFVEDACIKFKIERIILRLNSMRRIFSGNLARNQYLDQQGTQSILLRKKNLRRLTQSNQVRLLMTLRRMGMSGRTPWPICPQKKGSSFT